MVEPFIPFIENKEGILNYLNKGYKHITNGVRDGILIICGGEQLGKSELMLRLIYHLEPTITVDNIGFFGKDYRKLINEKSNNIIVLDEAGTSLFTREAMGEDSRLIIKKLMVCGFKHLLHILLLPDYFSLDKKIREQVNRDRLKGVIRLVGFGRFVTYTPRILHKVNELNTFNGVAPATYGRFEYSNVDSGFLKLRTDYRKKEKEYKNSYMAHDLKEEEKPKNNKDIAREMYTKLKVTQEALAVYFGVSRKTINTWLKPDVKK